MPTIREEAARLAHELSELENVEVRIAVFGQPGSGKSSLINALIGKPLATVGVATDTTREARDYAWNGLHLIDLPGYDTRLFPKHDYVARFDLHKLDLLVCVFDGKLHEADVQLLRVVREELKKPTVIVRSKLDVLWQEDKSEDELKSEITADIRSTLGIPDEHVCFVSCRTRRGLAELEERIDEQLDAAKRARWERTAKAYSEVALARKRAACERYVTLAAAAAAANGVNPLPGVDVAVDLTVLLKLFAEIRDAYGLETDTGRFGKVLPMLAPQLARLVQVASKEGALALLRRFASHSAAKVASKYVPVVGPVVAATLGFVVTKKAGDFYLDECHALAAQVLAIELSKQG
jgi:GTP-binding protein EngB required for normal cell division/uncharacterized protein (DUF697 family)